MSWFGAFRNRYGFTQYGDNRTAVTIDFPLVAVAYLCILLAVATLISTLGIRGRERWATTLRATYAVGIGSIILVCLVGHDWMTGSADIQSRYLYRSNNVFRGTVGLRISLHSCNVTLEGTYSQPYGQGSVYYAESMGWADYGKEHEMIGYYLRRGVPHPVMTVMDFLSFDSGGLRWGRDLHSAGYFAEALLWTAFAFWVLSNVLLMSVVVYGAFLFSMTGVAMILACVVYHVCQPSLPLRIEFGDSVLTTRYGWCFWLCLTSGITTICIGAMLFVLDHLFHEKVSEFFNIEDLNDFDLPDVSAPTLPVKGSAGEKLSEPSVQFQSSATGSTRHASLQGFTTTGGRRGSSHANGGFGRVYPHHPHQHYPGSGQRKGSIFLEPERRPSDFTSSVRHQARGGPFGGPGPQHLQTQQQQHGGGLGGFSNKGFEQERGKTNPLFCSGPMPRGIQEESGDEATGSGDDHGDRGREAEVRIDVNSPTPTSPTATNCSTGVVDDDVMGRRAYDNRKPSLATLREHRDNHMNEQQQFQSAAAAAASSSSSSESPFTFNSPSGPTSVIVHANSATPTTQSGRDIITASDVRVGGEGRGGITSPHIGCDSTADSAFASAAASPADSEKNSTCDDIEENRL